MESSTTKDGSCDNTNKLLPIPNFDRNEEMSVVSTLPRFADDDYIVFSFGEDGEIHVIKDGSSGASEHIDRLKKCSRRRINRKLFNTEGEVEEIVYKSNFDHRLSGDESNAHQTNEGESGKFSSEKGNVKLTTRSDIAMPIITPTDDIGSGDYSTHSNGSSGSFAFPVLNVEGVDSPVRMPDPNMLQLRRRHKKIWPTTCILCRRF